MSVINVVRFLTFLIAIVSFITTRVDDELRQHFMLSAFGLGLDRSVVMFEFLWTGSGNVTLDPLYICPYHTGYTYTIQHVGALYFTLLFLLSFCFSKPKFVKVMWFFYLLSSLCCVGLAGWLYYGWSDLSPARFTGYGLNILTFVILMLCKGRCSGKKVAASKKTA